MIGENFGLLNRCFSGIPTKSYTSCIFYVKELIQTTQLWDSCTLVSHLAVRFGKTTATCCLLGEAGYI